MRRNRGADIQHRCEARRDFLQRLMPFADHRRDMAQANDKTAGAALLILRFFLAVFLLQWSVEKLVVPNATIRIAQSSLFH